MTHQTPATEHDHLMTDDDRRTPVYKELLYFVTGRIADEDKARGYADRLFARIGEDAYTVEHARQRALATNAAELEKMRTELSAYQALVRVISQFTGARLNEDTAKRVYATLCRFGLGEMFRPGGGADRYLIPAELTEQVAGGTAEN